MTSFGTVHACCGDALYHAGLVDEAHDWWGEAAAILEDIDPRRAELLRIRTAGCCSAEGFAPELR